MAYPELMIIPMREALTRHGIEIGELVAAFCKEPSAAIRTKEAVAHA